MKLKLLYTTLLLITVIVAKAKFSYLKIILIIMLGWVINLFDPLLINNNYTTVVDNSPSIMKDLTIIITSCDKYSELWEPHFKMLFQNWPNINKQHSFIPIYLVSNFKKYNHSRITPKLVGNDKSWSDNLIKTLESVQTKYVLIILEDYIITDPVDEKRLIEIMHLMSASNAAYSELALDPNLADNQSDARLGIVIKNRFAESRVSLQTSIWEINTLKYLLEPGESAWDFEILGSIRSRILLNNFYLVTKQPVFQYTNATDKGKYRRSVIDYLNNHNVPFFPKSLPTNELL